MSLDNCTLTFTGQYVNLVDPDPDTISIIDIAHALSQINCYGGQTRRFYSVAQHSILASQMAPLKYRLQVLLHAAPIAYLGELDPEVKALPTMQGYRDMEDVLRGRIFYRFGMDMLQTAEFKECAHYARQIMRATERRDLMPPDSAPWPELDGIHPRPAVITPWNSLNAETNFLSRFKELAGSL